MAKTGTVQIGGKPPQPQPPVANTSTVEAAPISALPPTSDSPLEMQEPLPGVDIPDTTEVSTEPNYGDGKPPEWLWITEGKTKVVSKIYAYKDETSKLRAISTEVSYAMRALGLVEYPIESEWTIPSKDQLDGYKQRSSILDRTYMRSIIDRSKLQDEVTRSHLQTLKVHLPVGEGEQPQLIQLKRDKKNRLTEETLAMVKRLHPTILDMLWAKYLEESSLVV